LDKKLFNEGTIIISLNKLPYSDYNIDYKTKKD